MKDPEMNRRGFLKTIGGVGACALASGSLSAAEGGDGREMFGVLVDTTRCAGCRNCELVCAEAHGLPVPDVMEDSVMAAVRQPSETQWTVVNRFDTDRGEVFAKRQCMHCNQPACAAACLTKAMLKTEEGPVRWRESKCMGCRYCMVSCPYDVPKFEYHSAVPKIQKCTMCWDRVVEGKPPVCVENCPAEALTFGLKTDLLDEARRRIYADPDDYVHAIYGEHEVGGTGYLYLAGVPFEQIGLRTDLGTKAYPEFTQGFLYSVPMVLTLWPAFLLALNRANQREHESGGEE